MTNKTSDRDYVLRILVALEGKSNGLKAQKIATLLGGRIRQRLMNYGKIPGDPAIAPRLHDDANEGSNVQNFTLSQAGRLTVLPPLSDGK